MAACSYDLPALFPLCIPCLLFPLPRAPFIFPPLVPFAEATTLASAASLDTKLIRPGFGPGHPDSPHFLQYCLVGQLFGPSIVATSLIPFTFFCAPAHCWGRILCCPLAQPRLDDDITSRSPTRRASVHRAT